MNNEKFDIMKNIQKYAMVLLSCMAAAGMACSCTADWLREEDYPMAPGTGDTPVLTFDGEDALTVDNDGGDYSFSFTANLPWMIESRSSWITITSDHKGMGGSEPVTVTYNVSRNGTVDPREGSIRVWITDDAEYFVTISQEATPLEELGNNWYVKVGGTGDGSSWANATTLSDALASAADNDNIYVAAGTHYPTSMIPGGSSTRDNTFYVGANVSITGGFPVDAQEGAVADPSANPTILSGDFDGGPAYHVMVVAAPKSDLFSVNVSGVTLTGGSAYHTASTITINGAGFHKSYGAGLAIGNTRATFESCIIRENESTELNPSNGNGGYSAGIFNTDYAETHLINCVIEDNESVGNGGAIWNCATLYMDGCTVRNNVSNGVGAGLYNFYWNKGAREVNAYVY